MKIRMDDSTIQELPDELAVLIIADPSFGNTVPDFTGYEINVLIHSAIGAFYDSEKSFDENVDSMRTRYERITSPSHDAIQAAKRAVERYKAEVPEDQVGFVDADDMLQLNHSKQLGFDQ